MRLMLLSLCSLLLTGGMALAQQPDMPTQAPPLGTPPTFPQGQTYPTPDSMPPDTRAPAPQSTPSQPASASPKKVEGCLSGTAGNYILTDSSGATLQLHGDAAQLAKHVGKQVRITGTPMARSSEVTDQNGKADTSNTLLVSDLQTQAETCTPPEAEQKPSK